MKMNFLKRKNKDYRELVQGCINNDRRSQEALYKEFFPTMERMIRKHTTDKDQLIDILNNGFLRVFQKLDSFGFQGSFEGWIRKIIYHSMCDYFKKHQKDIRFMVFGDIQNDTYPTKSNHKLHFQDLLEMVGTLPEKHHKVFYMYAIEGYKHQEIGEALNINVNTSKWYLAEARKKLQENFKAELYK